ncbi:hypothetical protein C4544_07115 [candidate division WS5 bacterium]|uniref:Uncharacterized protein n=1 Tax=candidate division WS5 bacterium TaxID=2093353 RepID=A0A419DAH1_9BACT|nr:MAG: hypothetical protein C4544_07115 [candidate division WS5 bacterium]
MGILIGIIIGIIVVAGIGAGVYVVVFRAKHKKEVMENSQGGAVPSFGDTGGSFNPQAQTSEQPMGSVFDSPPAQGAAGGAVMNDITQGPVQSAPMPEAPQSSAEPASGNAFQPAINHDFPGNNVQEDPQAETPVSSMGGLDQTQENTFNAGQDNDLSQTNGTILDDGSGLSGSVADLAQTTQDVATDSGIEDSKVPVTGSDEATVSDAVRQPVSEPANMGAVPENVGESYTVPLETPVEPSVPTENVSPEPASFTPSPAPEPMPAPETPLSTNDPAQPTAPLVPEAPVGPSTDTAPTQPTNEKPEPPHMEI